MRGDVVSIEGGRVGGAHSVGGMMMSPGNNDSDAGNGTMGNHEHEDPQQQQTGIATAAGEGLGEGVLSLC